MRRVIVERLAIVEIATQEGDNPHRIFQSLNGTGVRLAEADLLRNYLFMLLPSRAERVYGEVWRPMEQLIGVDNSRDSHGWIFSAEEPKSSTKTSIETIRHGWPRSSATRTPSRRRYATSLSGRATTSA